MIEENHKVKTKLNRNFKSNQTLKNMSKIIVTIGILIAFFFLFGIIVFVNKDGGTPGLLGLILFAGLIAGLRAVWKKPESKSEITKTDKHQLDKRE